MKSLLPDTLSLRALRIIEAGSYSKLVVNGGTSAEARNLLDGVTPDQLLTVPVVNPVAAYCMLAGLWLWHDALHECHEIVQKSAADLMRAAPFLHQTPSKAAQKVVLVQSVGNGKAIKTHSLELMDQTLAYWHGIMHRREGDFWNSHYWFRQVGKHPAMKMIDDYEAHQFIDDAEASHAKGQSPAKLLDMQRREWMTLFAWCANA